MGKIASVADMLRAPPLKNTPILCLARLAIHIGTFHEFYYHLGVCLRETKIRQIIPARLIFGFFKNLVEPEIGGKCVKNYYCVVPSRVLWSNNKSR